MKHKLIIMVVALLFVIPASAPAVDLGSVIDSAIGGVGMLAEAAKEITPAEEHYIGRAVAAMILSKNRLYENTALTKYVNEVGLLLANASDRPSTYGGYHFAILNNDESNAYACPGGIIFVNRGLLKQVKNEDQLAAVLAHEVAHVAHRDGINTIRNSRWTKLGFYAAGEVGKHYTPDNLSTLVGTFQGVVTDVAKKVMESGYSKADEKKADASGMQYTSAVGYNPAEMLEFFRSSGDVGQKAGPFSSHPKASVRIKAIERDLARLPEAPTGAVRTQRFKGAMASAR